VQDRVDERDKAPEQGEDPPGASAG
jgi:hypothetical protein